jgi:hypothetical protein
MNFLQSPTAKAATPAKERKSLTAKAATPAKEKKSLTAKAAEDAEETIFEPTPERNAKTSPSMEWPQ